MTDLSVAFSHVHLYVDHVDDLAKYKEFEVILNKMDQEKYIHGDSNSNDNDKGYVPQNRDIIRQLMAGLGFRVMAARSFPTANTNTKSMLVTSCDPSGVQFVVSAVDTLSNVAVDENFHFDAANIHRFFKAHDGRQGIAVLGFAINNIDELYARYQQYHPTLILHRKDYNTGDHSNGQGNDGVVKILEAYAYYQGDTPESGVDMGTVFRFVQANNDGFSSCPLPGLSMVAAVFDTKGEAAYCDHWVSNVHSRVGFLKSLEDVLGFTPKVDFNAGVVAAGEAQIESTVTGNSSNVATDDPLEALRDQSQVYLPINNALSTVGHVHGFLQEIGQGVQHIASRVENLVDFVQRANDNRKRTGEGFIFLRIPRSYYGILTVQDLLEGDNPVSAALARAVMDACENQKLVTMDGAVDLSLTGEQIGKTLDLSMSESLLLEEFQAKKEGVIDAILKSRYKNLYTLLRGNIKDEFYLGIVRNQVLVDVQGDDLLYQIFTSNILQRAAGDEAPFLEFIQRVCAESTKGNECRAKIKPGCGGFGIRNFLTLFLSIEVSKAMTEVSEAKLIGGEKRRVFAQEKVNCFTNQLNESNPILTDISNAMTEEGDCKEKWTHYSLLGDEEAATQWKELMEKAGREKADGNRRLLSSLFIFAARFTLRQSSSFRVTFTKAEL